MASTAVLPAVRSIQSTDRQEGDARPDTPAMLAQLAQFDTLLSLQEDVSTGKHPRLKLPPKGPLAEASFITLSNPSTVPTKPVEKPTPSNSTAAAIQQSHSLQPAGSQAPVPVREPPTQTRTGPPGFDPILLTKSEHLIRAEKHLERQRVERSLETQLQRKRLAEKREAEQGDAPADFDVSEVLQRALEIVKPMSASEVTAANVNGSASDSIDNNTLYSSQANESETEDRADLRATKPCRYFFVEGKCLKGDRCDWSHDPAFKRSMQHPKTTDTRGREADAELRSRPGRRRSTRSISGRQRGSASQAMEDGEIDEGSYSPPRLPPAPVTHDEIQPPTEPAAQRRASGNRPRANEPATDFAGGRRASGRHSPTNGDGRVIRNHITSPVAPQPSRVSPLAVAKMTRVERVRQAAEDRSPRNQRQLDSVGQSSSSERAPTGKRRRGASPTEEGRNVAPRRQMVSPPLVIKAEPVSPAPLSQYPPRGYHAVEEVRSPAMYRPTHTQPRVIYEESRPAPRERVYVEDGEMYRVSPPSRRVVSGPVDPYQARREPELRRVYSSRQLQSPAPTHYAERGPSAVGHRHVEYASQPEYYSTSGSLRRPMSRATVIELEPAPPPPVYRASMQPQPTYLRAANNASPPPYSPHGYSPRAAMAATPRRIVTDQYGSRYYETPVMPERRPVSMIPEPRYATDMGPPRASGRPEPTGRPIYQPDPYGRPPSPTYVDYREMQPPPAPPRTPSRALSAAAPIVYKRSGDEGPYHPRVIGSGGNEGSYRPRLMDAGSTAASRNPRPHEPPSPRMGPPPPQQQPPHRIPSAAPSQRAPSYYYDHHRDEIPPAQAQAQAPVYDPRPYPGPHGTSGRGHVREDAAIDRSPPPQQQPARYLDPAGRIHEDPVLRRPLSRYEGIPHGPGEGQHGPRYEGIPQGPGEAQGPRGYYVPVQGPDVGGGREYERPVQERPGPEVGMGMGMGMGMGGGVGGGMGMVAKQGREYGRGAYE